MSLKDEFAQFAHNELQIPLVGVLKPDDFSSDDVERITPVIELFARSTPLAEGADTLMKPSDFLPEVRSVIVTGIPGYMGRVASFEECRKELLGRAEPSHVNIKFSHYNMEKGFRLGEFFTTRGFQFFSIVGTQYPVKLAASKCGIGFYGKNSVIQHPDFGSWISLMAYVTDAELEPDEPIHGDCGDCDLCMKACPAGAIYAPYRCDPARCVDFNLGHNKKNISFKIREKCSNLLGEGCTVCRDVCPKNRKLKPVEGFESQQELLHPSLLKIFDMSDDEWDNGYANTLMGFFLMDKKYLQRNAAISLGNFRDERALKVLAKVLDRGDDAVRGYAAWAIGKIGGSSALENLKTSLVEENNKDVKREIESAIAASR
jgi:epoxyqueuosine reductase QueG